jgi:hypothetical protein
MTNTIRFYHDCPCWRCLWRDKTSAIRVLRHPAYVQGDVANRVHDVMWPVVEAVAVRTSEVLHFNLWRLA